MWMRHLCGQLLPLLTLFCLAGSTFAADQAQTNLGLNWIQQQATQTNPTVMQQLMKSHQNALCNGCDPEADTATLQGLRNNPSELTRQGVNAYQTDPNAKATQSFQPSAPMDKQNIFVQTGNAIISTQLGTNTETSICAQTAPTTVTQCKSGYGKDQNTGRSEFLVLKDIVPPVSASKSAFLEWYPCTFGVYTQMMCVYNYQVYQYTGSGLQIGAAAGYYYLGIEPPLVPVPATIPEGQPFTLTIPAAGDRALPVTVTGQFQNGSGSITFSNPRDGGITIPVSYGGAMAKSEGWETYTGIMDESCTPAQSVCLDGPSTRMLAATAPADGNSYPFTRDCWEREVTYTCRGSAFDECAKFRVATAVDPNQAQPNCVQTASVCTEQDALGCRVTQETWSCGGQCLSYQATSLTEFSPSVPGQGMNGLDTGTALSKLIAMQALYRQDYFKDACNCQAKADAYKAASDAYTNDPQNPTLQAALDAAQNAYATCLSDTTNQQCIDAGGGDANTITAFEGRLQTCKRNLVGCNECSCKGVCSSLGICDRNDKRSFINAKENGLCHYVGDVKKRKLFGLPEVTSKYCCFNSKLSRIIHEQGRPQLNWDFGSPESPDCGPFSLNAGTPHYFGDLDFSRMDLTEYMNDIKVNVPDQQAITNKVKQGMQNVTP